MRPDRRRRQGKIPSRKLLRPAGVVAQVAPRRDSLLRPRQLAHDLLVLERRLGPRLGQRLQPPAVQREHELPRRVVGRKARLEAQADLQQRRPPRRARLRPARTVVGNPADQLAPLTPRQADLARADRRGFRPLQVKHIGQPGARRVNERPRRAEIHRAHPGQPILAQRRIRRDAQRVEPPGPQPRHRIMWRPLGRAHLVDGLQEKRPAFRIQQPPRTRRRLADAEVTRGAAAGPGPEFLRGVAGLRHGPRGWQPAPQMQSAIAARHGMGLRHRT